VASLTAEQRAKRRIIYVWLPLIAVIALVRLWLLS
jgi:hypothetical protein